MVLIDPGVFSVACQVHSKSFDVIGVPSSHTASGLMLMVRVMAASGAGASLPAGASLLGASLLGASVPGASVAAVVSPLPESSSLPHAAAMRAVPASNATNLALLGVLLTYLTSWVRVVREGRPGRASGVGLVLHALWGTLSPRREPPDLNAGVRPQWVQSPHLPFDVSAHGRRAI